MKKVPVTLDCKKNRLDKFLASKWHEVSRRKIQVLISSGGVCVNGMSITDAAYNLKYGDEILLNDHFHFLDEKPDLTPDADIKFAVLYEDEDLLVIDKPAGVTVHAGAGNRSHTLINGLVHHCGKSLSGGNGSYRPGIVHRIDKNTSGVLVVAKNDFTHVGLARQFAIHSIKRKYICFCYSILQPSHGKIETFLGRDKNNRLKMAVTESGRNAITFYRTLKTFSKFASKVECELKTGRTHQIRAHMSHRKCCIIGDALYKTKNYAIQENIAIREFQRQALHAYFLEFINPRSGKSLQIRSDLPSDLQSLEKVLQLVAKDS
ncbi:MAG: RluA family pseudouridine synthase [Holosporaceae bacterium]|jgi:23S rRNA pseudouridine1911/1915/1917 synthase|nr:RluA family pseudouridine synthase [Holosporaceae bacterium]